MKKFLLILGIVVVLAGFWLARPLFHLAGVAWRESSFTPHETLAAHEADDVSGLNKSQVADVIKIGPSLEIATDQVRAALNRAKREHLAVSMAGARHSEGGHTIPTGGLQLDMGALDYVHFDEATKSVTVGSGCHWEKVIRTLDGFGRSVSIMQSDYNFSVGGSLSVNCHGWQSGRPPLASSVRSFVVVTADGQVRRCSREENNELFGLVLGGYGLFGVILEAELETMPNQMLQGDWENVSQDQYQAALGRWLHRCGGPNLAYGRLSVAPSKFLSEARFTIFSPVEGRTEPVQPEGSFKRWLFRLIFRGQVESDYGKELRWKLERVLGDLGGKLFSRNGTLYFDAGLYLNRDPARTDILQEYFVPREGFTAFVDSLRTCVRRNHIELLNVTIRDVKEDKDTFLAYARGDRVALVLFFDQKKTSEAEGAMQKCTQELVDASLVVGGTYYLPYRAHPTEAQFLAAYPMAQKFAAAKKKWDPGLLFRNQFYDRYLAGLKAA
jgi:FAD/FMN-containing dehydrogenase